MFAIYESDKTPTLKMSELSVMFATDVTSGSQYDDMYEWIHQWSVKNAVVLVDYSVLKETNENLYWEIKSCSDGTNLVIDFSTNSVVVVYDRIDQTLLIQHKIAIATSLWLKENKKDSLIKDHLFADKFMHERNWGFRPDLLTGLWHAKNVRRNYYKLKGFKKHMNNLTYKMQTSLRSICMDM